MKRLLAAAAVLAFGFTGSANAAGILIDDFSTSIGAFPGISAGVPGSVSVDLNVDPGTAFGEKLVTLTAVEGLTLSSANTLADLLEVQGGNAEYIISLEYGFDGPNSLDFTGDGIGFDYGQDLGFVSYTIILEDDGGNTATFATGLPGLAGPITFPTTIVSDFASFAGIGAVDLTSIDNLTVAFSSVLPVDNFDVDIEVDNLRVVSAPETALLLGSGLLLLGFARRRRS